MRDFLLFHLYGPMASWGDIAVGEYRPSFAHPTKSAITGLLAAALGIRRDEDHRQKKLADSIYLAVRMDAMGILLRDYHTTQVPSAKRGVIHYSRSSELSVDELHTILSSRDYRCDAACTVAISVSTNSPYTASKLATALQKPVFTLYLGRKSCPPALPLHPRIVRKETLREAFAAVSGCSELSDIHTSAPLPVYWEEDFESGLNRQQVIIRRDAFNSRKRWQFSERHENCGTIGKGKEPCISV